MACTASWSSSSGGKDSGIYTYVYDYVWMCVQLCVSVCVYVCVCVGDIYIYICIYTCMWHIDIFRYVDMHMYVHMKFPFCRACHTYSAHVLWDDVLAWHLSSRDLFRTTACRYHAWCARAQRVVCVFCWFRTTACLHTSASGVRERGYHSPFPNRWDPYMGWLRLVGSLKF